MREAGFDSRRQTGRGRPAISSTSQVTVTGEADGKHGERSGVLRVRLSGELANGGSPERQPDWWAELRSA